MKKLTTVILLIIFNLSFFNPVQAATASPSAAQGLLERVATKVATLAEKLKKGVAGEITVIGTKTISLGNQRVLVSEATTYYRIKSGAKTTIDFKNLLKGDDVAVVGTADSATGDITARQIIAKVQRLPLTGKVTTIDKKTGVYTLAAGEDIKEVEIDSLTIIKKVDAKGAFIKVKLADIIVGDNLIVYGYYNKPNDPLTTIKADIISSN